MKTLYFCSYNDGEITSFHQTDGQAVSIANLHIDEYLINFLIFKRRIIDSKYLSECQSSISKSSIRTVLDAAGYVDKNADNGIELNKILLDNPKSIKHLVQMAVKDKTIANYLYWLTSNYFKLFEYYYGELVLIESVLDDMDILPKGFKTFTFYPNNRVFYSKLSGEQTKDICKVLKSKPSKVSEVPLILSALLITFGQLVMYGSGFLDELINF